MGSGSSRRRGPAGRAGQSRDPPGTAPADAEGAAAPPGPGYRAPAAGGSAEPRSGAEAAGGGGGAPLQQAVHVLPVLRTSDLDSVLQALSTRSPPSPENNNLDHQCPEGSKKPLGQPTILYDYSEEELMASIEREYCR
ncbi:cystin-1 [Melozone crissalis]|uniref:cystin-1 n=1 Tax=Melozone crissalis TaxID=40204 RepID=UPI0023DBC850|nr:cystin-1 [Melozone crissalis]